MKIFEYINELKETNATIDEIANWFYMNRIYPYDVVYNNALEVNKPIREDAKRIMLFYDCEVIREGVEAVYKMLNCELDKE